MSEQKGVLRFKIYSPSRELANADLPVKVLRPDLTVEAETVSSMPLELDEGTYYVTVRVPAGQELFARAHVAAGTSQTVELKPLSSEEDLLWTPLSDSAPMSWWQQGLLLLRYRGVREALGLRRPTGRLRFFSGNLLAGKCEFTDAVYFMNRPLSQIVRLDPLNDLGSGFIQLVQPGTETVNVAFPNSFGAGCFLFLHKPSSFSYSVDVHLKNGTADLLLRYMERGMLQDAATTAKSTHIDSERLFRDKEVDPASAAVGAYTLLRLGNPERLDAWTANLMNRFPRLPDGLAIRGEHLARLGHHSEALDAFIKLTDRGLPYFTDGITYALDRLRLYTKGTITGSQGEAAESLLGKLEALSHHVDFNKSLLTFYGVSPLAPDNDEFANDVNSYKGFDLSNIQFGVKG